MMCLSVQYRACGGVKALTSGSRHPRSIHYKWLREYSNSTAFFIETALCIRSPFPNRSNATAPEPLLQRTSGDLITETNLSGNDIGPVENSCYPPPWF